MPSFFFFRNAGILFFDCKKPQFICESGQALKKNAIKIGKVAKKLNAFVLNDKKNLHTVYQ